MNGNGNDDRLTLYTQDHTGRLWSIDTSTFSDTEIKFAIRALRQHIVPRIGAPQRRSSAMSTMATVASMAALAMGSYASVARNSGLFKPPIRSGRR